MCQIHLFPQYASCLFLLSFAATDGEPIVQPSDKRYKFVVVYERPSVLSEASQWCLLCNVSNSTESEMTCEVSIKICIEKSCMHSSSPTFFVVQACQTLFICLCRVNLMFKAFP